MSLLDKSKNQRVAFSGKGSHKPERIVEVPEERPEEPAVEFEQLQNINVSGELAFLLQQAKQLMRDVMGPMDDTPANQKAQVLNSLSSLLRDISKTRTDLYNSERVRNIEVAVVQAMRGQPTEVIEKFLENLATEFEQLAFEEETTP